MTVKTLLLTTGLVLLAFSPCFAVPTFDCGKAFGEVEELICRDQELADLDQTLADVYGKALQTIPATEHADIRAFQRGWIKGRNDCWKAEDVRECVVMSYRTRIVALQIKGGMLEVPRYSSFVCNEDPRRPFTAVFYNQTSPRSAVLTWHPDQVIVFIQHSGSGARYAAPGVEFWEHQGDATIDWYGTRLHCVVR